MRLVLFDCDGTLVDSKAVIVASMSAAFRASGLEPPPREEIVAIVGLSLPKAISTLLHDHPEAPVAALTAAYAEAYRDLGDGVAQREALFPGVAETLRMFSAAPDIVMGIATGKSRRGLDRVLAAHQMESLFVTLQTADDAPSKPAPGMVLNALAATGIEPGLCVVIGDTSFDMEMARSAGVGAVGVAWGYHDPGALVVAGAHAVADSAQDLPDLVDRLVLPAA